MINEYKCTICGALIRSDAQAEEISKKLGMPNLCKCQIEAMPNEGRIEDLPKGSLEFVREIIEDDKA